MIRDALGCVLLVGALANGHARADSGEPAAQPYWTTCSARQDPDCERTPESYFWPDSRFGIGATLDVVFRDADNDVFAKAGPALRIGSLMTYDLAVIDGIHPGVIGVELGYRLEQLSTSMLFGGEVTTALTSHDVYAGATYKILSDRSTDPTWGWFVRTTGGLGFGPLVVRDVRSGTRDEAWSGEPFLDLGLGLVIRMLGLLLEAGYEFAFAREFAVAGDNGTIPVSRKGMYLRGGVIIHIP